MTIEKITVKGLFEAVPVEDVTKRLLATGRRDIRPSRP
jgi:hypothetical protein